MQIEHIWCGTPEVEEFYIKYLGYGSQRHLDPWQFRRHVGALVGLASLSKAPSYPKLKYETL